MNDNYPFDTSPLVQEVKAAILSAALPDSVSVGKDISYQFAVVDRSKGKRFETWHASNYSDLLRPFSLDFIPSKKAIVYLIVWLRYRNLIYSTGYRMPYSFNKKIRVYITPADFQRATRKSRNSASQTVKYRLRLVPRGVYTKSVRLNPEQYYTTFPFRRQHGSTPGFSRDETRLAYEREWSGTTTPGFGRLSKSRLPVNNHFVHIQQIRDSGYLTQQVNSVDPESSSLEIGAYQGQLGTSMAGPALPSCQHLNLNATRDKATRKLINQADKGGFGLALNIAELHQATSMFALAASRISTAVVATKRGNISLAVKTLWGGQSPKFPSNKVPSSSYTAAQNWLMLQYGYKPLMKDVEDACRIIPQFMGNNKVVHTLSTSASTGDVNERWILAPNDVGAPPILGEFIQITKTQVKLKLRYTIDSELTSFLAQAGFTNPIDLVWELIPWSFVVDWFLPVGSYLESLHSWDGLTFLDGCETRFTRQTASYRQTYTGNMRFDASIDPIVTYTQKGALDYWAIRLNRVKITSFPTLSTPSLKNPLSSGHISNALALLVTSFKR